MNHYVYRITNKILNKYYYGVRSSDIEPKLDLGVKYFSSSSDKEFRKDQKNHPENFKYKIVRICSNRKEASALEKKLHEKFNVGINESFYNKAIQTSTGFDTTGVKHTPETRQKMSEAKKGENNSMFGKKHSDETKQKLSKPLSDERRLKISEAKQNISEETRQKMSEAKKGVPKSDEHKLKLSEAHKGPQEQVECPHCGKIGGKSLMTRWHFDNCKYKEFKEEN
jgi:group I intron endonuclease